MKLLWLCNMAPGPVQKLLGGRNRGGLWMDHVLADLRTRADMEICILTPHSSPAEGQLDDRCRYRTFPKGKPQQVHPQQEPLFREVLEQFCPDVIHIWGTEFGHTLAMLRACGDLGYLDRTVVSLQGLCSVYARHYAEGVPAPVQTRSTFRDLLRQDNIYQQGKVFEDRGRNEIAALRLARHVIGRTPWDRACARLINPEARYHFCNETLREEFYTGSWSYTQCRKHRIFASSRLYPIKGFHYLLEAFALLRRTYPDATLAVPGKDPVARTVKERLRQDGYARYLERLTAENHLEGSIEYLGTLSAREMKEQYLMANAFVLPSTIENSPNSLGEAMLLGVPCAAANVGGVSTMLQAGREGLIYPSTAPYMLEDALEEIFALGEQAGTMGAEAALHARRTHDPETNFRQLLGIYSLLSGKELL